MPRLLPLVLISLFVATPAAHAHGVSTRTIEIIHPWTFGTPTAGGDIEVCAKIKNIGRKPDRLVGVETTLARAARIVDTRPASPETKPARGLVISPGGAIELTRSGPHIRLDGFAKAQSPYDTFALTLIFERAGRIVVEVLVEEKADGRPGPQRCYRTNGGKEPSMRLLALGFLAAQLALGTALAHAQDFAVGPIRVSQPWTRVPPDASKVAGGFMTITNTGTEADTLVGGTAVVSGGFEVHEMPVVDGVMRMRELNKGLDIKPGQTVELKPGGYHIMFMQLKEPLVAGKPLKGTLVFEKAGTIEVEYAVAPIGAREMPASGGHSHH